MGIELDVLVGHPEHDLIFVGIQVAKAAGLRDYSGSVMAYRYSKIGKDGPRFTIGSFMEDQSIKLPEDYLGQRLRFTTAMMTEPQAFQMLLRGHAPASEPFRKWVAEEVLPTIRKTGSYVKSNRLAGSWPCRSYAAMCFGWTESPKATLSRPL